MIIITIIIINSKSVFYNYNYNHIVSPLLCVHAIVQTIIRERSNIMKC